MEWIKFSEKMPEKDTDIFVLIFEPVINQDDLINGYIKSFSKNNYERNSEEFKKFEKEKESFSIYGFANKEESNYKLNVKTGAYRDYFNSGIVIGNQFLEDEIYPGTFLRWSKINNPKDELKKGDCGYLAVAWKPIEYPEAPDMNEFLK